MKKRLISMVLALSMMLSLCPAAAFADTGSTDMADGIVLLAAVEPTAPLVIRNGYPWVTDFGSPSRQGVRFSDDKVNQLFIYEGLGWVYTIPYTDADGVIEYKTPRTLTVTADADLNGEEIASGVDVVVSGGTLKNGTIDGDLTIGPNGRVDNVTANGNVTNDGTIGSGEFNGDVTNNGTIEDGKFNGDVTNNGTIKDGEFTGDVTNNGTIEDGSFSGEVTNNGTIKDGDFSNKVDNKKDGTIEDGKFTGDVNNDGKIDGGDFSGKVDNNQTGSIEDGNFSGDVNNNGKVDGGDFSGSVDNKQDGSINGGSFSGDVNGSGTISSGVFNGEDGKGPNGKIDPDAIRSTVRFYNGQKFNANDTLTGVAQLLVIGKQEVTVSTISTRLNNVYHESTDGTKSWTKLSRSYSETLTIEGGDYVLNLPERTAGDFTYNPDDRTVTSKDGSISADDIKVSYYGPDDADHEAQPPFTEPGDYVIKISVPGSSDRMEISGLGDSNWAFTVDPKLTFNEAQITVKQGEQSLHSGDSIAAGTRITLETDDADFEMWSIIGLSGLTEDELSQNPLTISVPKSNLSIGIQTKDAPIVNPSDGSGVVLGVAAGAVGGAAIYYLGATAFLRTVLPSEVALPNNRAALANALWVLHGRPETTNTTEFVDVPANSPDLQAIRWVLEQGAMTATVREDGVHFMPDRFATRTESLLTWYRLYCRRAELQNK